MALPQPFTTASPVIATFNFQDIADGTGTQTLYGGIGEDSSGEFYTLDKTILRTSVLSKSGTVNNQSDFEKGIDIDFDTAAFNVSRTVSGKVNTGISWSQVEGAGALNFQGYVKVILKRVDADSTETTIATMQSPTASGGEARLYLTDFMEATATETVVAVGEKLRVTVECWWYQEAGTSQGAVSNRIYVDPLNAESADTQMAAGKTQFFVNVPFKIE